jgi:regulatory protein
VHVRESRYGNLRIRQELAQHGVTLDADQAQRLKETELARAHEVWVRKFGAAATDPAGRAKQQRFLAGRGFSAEVIRRVVKGDVDEAAW